MSWTRFFRRRYWDKEWERELDAYLEAETDENIARGMSPEEAHYAAHRKLGNTTLIREEIYYMNSIGWLDALWQDLRFGLRMVRQNPGFTAVVVLTLALGIGANAAIFSVVNTVLLKPLPYAQPERLVAVESTHIRRGPIPHSLSYPDFFDFRAQNHVFEHLVTWQNTNLTLTGAGAPTKLDAAVVTWDMFLLLGIQPQLGRGFLPSEEAAGTHVVVLSHLLWQTQFGGARDIVGRTMTLDGDAYTVIGVAPAGCVFPVNEPDIQLWTTIAIFREVPPGSTPVTEQRGARMLTALGRLKPGVGIQQARADLNVIAAALARQYPDSNTNIPQASVRPELETLVGGSRTPLLILLGAVGLVLLIACANIAHLLLARTANRSHEMAIRAALGALRGRVVRQLLTESLLLAVLGGAAGLVLAEYALRVVLPLGGGSIPRLAQTTIDGRVLAFALALTFLTIVFIGLAPALAASQVDFTAALKEGSRESTCKHERLRGALVAAQMALGCVLVTAAGLLMASFLRLETSDLGLKPDHLLTFWFRPDPQHDAPQEVAFYDQLLDRLRALPGVESVGGVWPLPLGGDEITVGFNIEERPAPHSQWPVARIALTTPDYFHTAGIPLLKGRIFNDHDDAKAPRVLIVNKAFADTFFPGEEVIGKRIRPGAGASGEKSVLRTIIGVVGSAKLSVLEAKPQPIYYFPYKQVPWQPPVVLLRTVAPPQTLESAIRKAMAALDSNVPVFQIRTMDSLLSTQVTGPRFHAVLLGCFAGMALLLTVVGLYGLMAYSVAQRTHEIGVRLALGASRSAVLSMVLKRAVALTAAGLGLGFAGSLATVRLLRSMLFRVSPLDPRVLGLSCLLIAATPLLAAYLPARRAAKVDPMTALRYE